jgi:hypothetical protein
VEVVDRIWDYGIASSQIRVEWTCFSRSVSFADLSLASNATPAPRYYQSFLTVTHF